MVIFYVPEGCLINLDILPFFGCQGSTCLKFLQYPTFKGVLLHVFTGKAIQNKSCCTLQFLH